MTTPPEEAFQMGLAAHRQGDWQRAEQCYQRAVALAPAYSDAWNNLGVVAQNRNQTSQSITFYITALRHNPKFVAAWGNLGAVFEGVGRFKESAACYEAGLRLSEKAEILSNLAGLYREMGQFQKAYICYRKAVKLGGENLLHIHSAWCFTVDQDPSSTIADRVAVKRAFREGLNAQA